MQFSFSIYETSNLLDTDPFSSPFLPFCVGDVRNMDAFFIQYIGNKHSIGYECFFSVLFGGGGRYWTWMHVSFNA